VNRKDREIMQKGIVRATKFVNGAWNSVLHAIKVSCSWEGFLRRERPIIAEEPEAPTKRSTRISQSWHWGFC